MNVTETLNNQLENVNYLLSNLHFFDSLETNRRDLLISSLHNTKEVIENYFDIN
jgi:hypothetical protein